MGSNPDSVAPYGGAWIETIVDTDACYRHYRRSLWGSVD